MSDVQGLCRWLRAPQGRSLHWLSDSRRLLNLASGVEEETCGVKVYRDPLFRFLSLFFLSWAYSFSQLKWQSLAFLFGLCLDFYGPCPYTDLSVVCFVHCNDCCYECCKLFWVVHKHLWFSCSHFSSPTIFYSGGKSCVSQTSSLVFYKLPPSFRFSPLPLVNLPSYHNCCKTISHPYALCKYDISRRIADREACYSVLALQRRRVLIIVLLYS